MNLFLEGEYWAIKMYWFDPLGLFQVGLCFIMLIEF